MQFLKRMTKALQSKSAVVVSACTIGALWGWVGVHMCMRKEYQIKPVNEWKRIELMDEMNQFMAGKKATFARLVAGKNDSRQKIPVDLEQLIKIIDDYKAKTWNSDIYAYLNIICEILQIPTDVPKRHLCIFDHRIKGYDELKQTVEKCAKLHPKILIKIVSDLQGNMSEYPKDIVDKFHFISANIAALKILPDELKNCYPLGLKLQEYRKLIALRKKFCDIRRELHEISIKEWTPEVMSRCSEIQATIIQELYRANLSELRPMDLNWSRDAAQLMLIKEKHRQKNESDEVFYTSMNSTQNSPESRIKQEMIQKMNGTNEALQKISHEVDTKANEERKKVMDEFHLDETMMELNFISREKMIEEVYELIHRMCEYALGNMDSNNNPSEVNKN